MDRRLMQAQRTEMSLILAPMRFVACLGEAYWAVLQEIKEFGRHLRDALSTSPRTVQRARSPRNFS